MYTIGETSSLNQISIKALRHYDKIGLLKPAYIDDQNGYRYYTYEQFSYIDKIKRYKNLGMSLSEIKDFFETQSNQVIEDFLEQQKEIVEKNERKLILTIL